MNTPHTIASDAQHETSDRIGGSTAIVEHVGPRVVPSRRGILRERAEQIVEERDGQVEFANRVAKRGKDLRIATGVGRVSSVCGRFVEATWDLVAFSTAARRWSFCSARCT